MGTFSPYASGQGYWLSKDAVSWVKDNVRRLPSYPLEVCVIFLQCM